jgi:hypothetical protein
MMPVQKLTREVFRVRYTGEKPEYELIDGQAEQKTGGTEVHSSLQLAAAVILEKLGFRALIELTLPISETWELVPDVVGDLGPPPEGPYPTKAVPAVIEILSPDDPFLKLVHKCRKSAEWGIADILVLDPVERAGWRWDNGTLVRFDTYAFRSLPGRELSLEELFRRMSIHAPGGAKTTITQSSSLYESDFHVWCLEQARLVRELRGQAGALDVEHVAQEMESLALRERDQLENYLRALVAWRLQYDYQQADRTHEREWHSQIVGQQHNIEQWLADSPSLKGFLAETIEDAYQSARIFASTLTEGGLEYDFPPRCPYTFAQLMEDNRRPKGHGPQYQDVIELAKGADYTLVVDENMAALKAGLIDEGYKVVVAPQGASHHDIKDLARGGCGIVTMRTASFLDDANHFDYDVIAIETNGTVVKIAGALRRSDLATRKGNFLLRVLDDGSFHLRQLV